MGTSVLSTLNNYLGIADGNKTVSICLIFLRQQRREKTTDASYVRDRENIFYLRYLSKVAQRKVFQFAMYSLLRVKGGHCKLLDVARAVITSKRHVILTADFKFSERKTCI